MFRNYLAAALRNLTRNRLYAGVTIAGLAVGFAAAILIGLYVRDELSYERFIPGHERVYAITQKLKLGGSKPFAGIYTPMMMARPFKEEFPEVESLARLSPSYFPPTVRRGEFSSAELNFFWADPDFFRVIPLPVVAGDPVAALAAPDALVLTRSMARKYFGQDAPIGKVLLVDGQPLRVSAVIEDLPSSTHLTFQLLGSSRAAQSPISRFQAINGPLTNTLVTYVRLRPGASLADITPRLPDFLLRRLPLGPMPNGVTIGRRIDLEPIARIHFIKGLNMGSGGKPPADPAVIEALGAVGLLIVVVAAINFVTLMTARAARRAVEVGVRKAAGADRRDLILQFMGEALIYVLAAAILAVSLAELLLPAADALLQRRLVLDYLHDPTLAGAVLAIVLITAVLAGLYPAVVLSSFRPSAVLKGGPIAGVGGSRIRQALVVAQFAVLIGLMLTAATIARQTRYALNEGMRVDKDQVLLLFSNPCQAAVRDVVVNLPGVKRAACASDYALELADSHDSVLYRGRPTDLAQATVDFGFFEVFGVKPLAGRLFDRAHPADGALDDPERNSPVILNESAVRRLGFATPQAAIGQTVLRHALWDETQRSKSPFTPPLLPSTIIGVVPDFTFGSMRQQIPPMQFEIGRIVPPDSVALAIKLDGAQLATTLPAIEKVWKRAAGGRAYLPTFVDRFTMRLYVDTIIQGATVAIAAIVALVVAGLGLFALSAYTTDRRTKEIGVRKAMGASASDILKLLLWQFTKPVIWANLIAWPAAFVVMRWWLSGFAYHVGLAPWTFLAAGAGALVIAWATVFVHALHVARAKPVGALRYE